MDIDKEQIVLKLREYKQPIVSGLLLFGFGATIFNMRRSRANLAALHNNPVLKQNPRYLGIMMASRALMYATSIVGITAIGVGYGVSTYMEVDTLQEFSVKFKIWAHKTFPSLVIKDQSDENDVVEFMQEFKIELDKPEPKESSTHNYISDRLMKGLGLREK
ncbi:hypothetical protein HK103_002611 [Boothiomyces macroporosus]|uniref:Altered inheritance of mitochondria protein 11 n=1 Tax=Boothiomyces macroporosus TaxID=261099 RepID=A0AAD5UA19_9FUNG|nr:hypothetical protein HK103_002611 [Boothiomyces macroporosus]